MTSPRLYIATRDPRDGGGVQSMARSVYRAAEKAGYDPCIVCNMLDSESQTRITQPIQVIELDPAENVRHMTVDGLEVKGIPLVIPEVEFTHYILNRSGWREATDDGDVFFAVGGTNQCNLPFVDQGAQFGSWTATLLWEDRVDRLQSAPLVERIRDWVSRPILEYLEEKGFEAADHVTVLSEYTAHRLRQKYGIEADDIIPYPINTNRFSPDKTGDEPDSNGPVVLFVGRFNDPRKNTTTLVEAFAEVRKTIADAELWLIGSEPNNRIREAIQNQDLDEAVTYHDRVPNKELPRYYRAADLFVIPSNQEGLAIVGLEAMACGTPVVATKCGGPEQYIVEDKTGYLVPRSDPASMANRIVEVLSDEEQRMRLSQNSRDLIRDEYDASKIRNRFQTILEELHSNASPEPE